jgi:hypothetical protein
MRLSDRFIDYATTGAFFIVSQLILLASWNPRGLLILFFWLSVPSVPSWLQTPIDGLLAALGISSIFFFGLVLDLLGSALRSGELQRFHQQLLRNHDWLPCMAKQDPFFARGLTDFLQLDRLENWTETSPWKTSLRDIFKEALPDFVKPSNTYVKYKEGYSRLRYYLNSFISFNNPGAALDAVSDQTHLWRTGRAICVATIVLTGECLLALLVALLALIFHWPSIPLSPSTGVQIYSFTFLALLLAMYITSRMALEPYSRMYANTLTLAYLTYKKLYETPDADKAVPGESTPKKMLEVAVIPLPKE